MVPADTRGMSGVRSTPGQRRPSCSNEVGGRAWPALAGFAPVSRVSRSRSPGVSGPPGFQRASCGRLRAD